MEKPPFKNLLFTVYETSDLPRMLAVAKFHKQQGDNIYFFFPLLIPIPDNFQNEFVQHGIPIINQYSPEGALLDISFQASEIAGKPVPLDMLFKDWKKYYNYKGNGRVKEAIYTKLAKYAGIYDEYLATFDYMAFNLQIYSKICRMLNLDLVIMPVIDSERIDSLLWRALEDCKFIKTLVLHAGVLFKNRIYEVYSQNPQHMPENRHNAKVWVFLPWRWKEDRWGHKFLRMPLPMLLAQEAIGVALPQPHMANSNARNIVCESLFVYNKLRDYGVNVELSTDIIGACELDSVHDKLANLAQRQDFLLTQGLDPAKKTFLFCAPRTLQQLSPRFTSLDEASVFIIKILAADERWQVLVSPHPSLEPASLEALKGHGGLVINQGAVKLLPYADICVSTGSAIDTLALALGVPVVEYDLGSYRQHRFRGVSGVLTVDDEDTFLKTVHTLQNDNFFVEEWMLKTYAYRDEFGVIDGKACQRFFTVSRRVLEQTF